MKKALGVLKSNILIFVGALLLLIYINYFAGDGSSIAIGVFATVIGVYYVVIGMLNIFIGNKLKVISKKVLDVIGVCLFALFIFTISIFNIASIVENNNNAYSLKAGPTAWIIAIFYMLSSFALAGFYPFARFFKNQVVKKVGYLLASLFSLALLLDVLFDFQGFTTLLGNIPLVLIVLELLFVFYLFDSLVENNEEVKEIAQKEQPEEKATSEEKLEEQAEEKVEEVNEEKAE